MAIDLSKFTTKPPTAQPVEQPETPTAATTSAAPVVVKSIIAPAKPAIPSKPATPEATAKPESSSGSATSSLAAKLAGLQSSSKLSARLADPTIAARAKAATEQAEAAAQVVEVPPELLELNQSLTSIDGFPAEELQRNLANVYKAIEQDQPDLPLFLENISKQMRQYEELAYLLTDDQLGLFFNGVMKHTNANIKTAKPKKTAASLELQLQKEGGMKLDDLELGKGVGKLQIKL